MKAIENKFHARRHTEFVKAVGTGALRWVTAGCLSTALLNAGLGFLAGSQLGGVAVVAVNAVSLAFGYLVLLAAYHLENRVAFSELLPEESGVLLFVSASALVLFPFFCNPASLRATRFGFTAAAMVALIAMMGATMWFHPMRARLLGWLFARVPV